MNQERAYDVVIADFCGPVSADQVRLMLGDGAHVLKLLNGYISYLERQKAK